MGVRMQPAVTPGVKSKKAWPDSSNFYQYRIAPMTIKTLAVLFLCSILTLLAACQPQNTDREMRLAFKGIELYSWQTDVGEWRYSLLPGTNRIKTVGEVTAAPLDQAALEAALLELPPGETVFWSTRADQDDAGLLAIPPQDLVDAVTRTAAEAGVRIEVVRS